MLNKVIATPQAAVHPVDAEKPLGCRECVDYPLWNVLYSADRRTYPVPTRTGSDNEPIGNHGALLSIGKGLHYMRSCDADLTSGLDPGTQDDKWIESCLFVAHITLVPTKFD